jgi:EAL domain-containing protein (putative c-di-GMP-specific phosphodiesterase class I)/CheY-like chemotaxis protein
MAVNLAAVEAPDVAALRAAPPDDEATGLRLLIADDDPMVRELLVDLFGSEPTFELVGVAGDAEEVVELIDRVHVDVALVDVRMPGGGGPRATRAIRRRSPATKVVALSAYDDARSVLEMLQAGADGYLVKGGADEDLVEAVRRAAVGTAPMPVDAGRMPFEEGDGCDALGFATTRPVAPEPRDVLRAIATEAMGMVFQPIHDLAVGRVAGYEALARFTVATQSPEIWFVSAQGYGLAIELELVAIRLALRALPRIPEDAFLSVNASPATAVCPELADLLEGVEDRVVLEITEYTPIPDSREFLDALRRLRVRGVRIAVDDTGTGFAGLDHILRLTPDIVKLDAVVTRDIDHDEVRRSLTTALGSVAAAVGAQIVAEGIETDAQLAAVRALGVRLAQGYHLGRPGPLPG